VIRALLVALALAWVAPFAAAQDKSRAKPQEKPQEPPLVRCVKCKNSGHLPCPAHEKSEMPFEEGVVFCTTIAKCETCRGTGWLDCLDCSRPDVEDALAKKIARQAGCAKISDEFDAKMNRPLRKVITDHCTLVWELDSLKVEKRNVEHHELMHLYAQRLEHLFADYCNLLKCEANEFQEKIQVFVWWLPKDQIEGSLRFVGEQNQNGVKLLGAHAVYSVCGNRQFFQNDERLHRNIVHNVSHLLLAHQNPQLWLGNIKGGWAEEGLGHWFEDRYFNRCDTYCYEEQNTNEDFKGGVWKPVVRKMVATGNLTSVAEVTSKNTDQLALSEHALAFSYVDYLLAHDGQKFNNLCRQLRRKVELRDAFKSVFDMSLIEFETKWKAWVLETYPTR
jgi:hypothetical protein